MSPAGAQPSELVDFIEVLRLSGYEVSAEQYIAAQRLLVTLAAQGDLLDRPESLATLLAPVLCTSPEEQEAFPRNYAQWLNSRPRLFATQGGAVEATEPTPLAPKVKPEARIPSPHIKWWYWPAALGVIAAITSLFFSLRPATAQTLTFYLTVFDETSAHGSPIFVTAGSERFAESARANNGSALYQVRFAILYRSTDLPMRIEVSNHVNATTLITLNEPLDSLGLVLSDGNSETSYPPSSSLGQKLWRFFQEDSALFAGVASGVMLASVLLLWLRRRARRMGLEKWRSENEPRLDKLVVKGSSEYVARAFPLRRTAQELRRHREYGASDLDVQRTIESTIRSGLFTPAYAPRKSLPEYLVLIDRSDFEDHKARLADEIVERLMKNDVFIERFYFQGDPRVCRKDDPKAPYQTLQSLAAQYPNHCLLVFSDADRLFNPVTGRPQYWLRMFSPWETRILLTSELHADDYREWALIETGFRVLPDNRAGLSILAETLHTGSKKSLHADGAGSPLPAILRVRPGRWLEAYPPAPPVIEELCQQLESFLGEEGYYWLSACAVYPLPNWDLTLYLGHKLYKKGDLAETLSKLVRLPWLRQGSMPDWLRERLIFELSPEQERLVRDALQQLLLSSLLHPEGFNLFFARESQEAEAGLLRRAWRRLSGRGRDEERFVLDNLSSEPEGSGLRDYVFLSFMAGRKPNRLALSVPEELRQALYPLETPSWELKAIRALIPLTLVFSALLLAIFASAMDTAHFVFAALTLSFWAWLAVGSLHQLTGATTEAGGFFKKALTTWWAGMELGTRLKSLSDFVVRTIKPLTERIISAPAHTAQQEVYAHTITPSAEIDTSPMRGAMARRDIISVAGDYVAATPPPRVTLLHQLPPPPRDFTGRERELGELMSQVERGVTISGLQGQGGIGKTALALELARRLAPRYPDAQLYLDLKGASSQQPVSIAEALSHVIRAYHPTEKLPEGVEELRAIYLSVLHGQRALLLMDNARDAAQVEPLIPPDTCVLLVTSRRHFTLPGLYAKRLDTLTPAESRELLLKIAPRIGERADDIAALCGQLPLALRLAASALAERRDLSPQDYVRRLSDAPRGLKALGEVEPSLGLSYDLLGADLQKLWRSLAVFPSPFDARAAAAVWQLEPDAAQDALGDLLNFSMLDYDAATARYRLHPLARLFADARLKEGERDSNQRRHAEHYLKVFREADDLYLQGGESVKAALALFDLESRNIQAGQAWATAQAREDDAAAVMCFNYPAVGAYLLQLRQNPRERIQWLEVALAAARRMKAREAEGAHAGSLGIAYMQLGETRRAVRSFEQQLMITREISDRRGEGYALGNLGQAYASLNEPRRAVEFYEQCLDIMREIYDRRGEGYALGALGRVFADLGEAGRAVEFYEQCLVITREIGDRYGEAQALGNLGLMHYVQGDVRRATELYQRQLEIARQIGDRYGEGISLFNMSLALEHLGDRAQAIAHAEAALEIFEQIESPHAEKVRGQLEQWRGGSTEAV
jgi:Tfp pilus assembly protein PilF